MKITLYCYQKNEKLLDIDNYTSIIKSYDLINETIDYIDHNRKKGSNKRISAIIFFRIYITPISLINIGYTNHISIDDYFRLINKIFYVFNPKIQLHFSDKISIFRLIEDICNNSRYYVYFHSREFVNFNSGYFKRILKVNYHHLGLDLNKIKF